MNFVFEAYLNMHVLWQTAKAESLSKIEFKNLLHFLGPIIRPIHKKSVFHTVNVMRTGCLTYCHF